MPMSSRNQAKAGSIQQTPRPRSKKHHGAMLTTWAILVEGTDTKFGRGRRARATGCQAAPAAPQTVLPGLPPALEPWLPHFQESPTQGATGAGQEMPRSEAVRMGRVSRRAQSPGEEDRSWMQGQCFPNLLQKPEISIFVSS